jgi:transposase
VKSLASHERKALLIVRHQLVDMRVRIDNQLRGILKTFGLVIGKCNRGQLGQRARELSEGRPGVDSIVRSRSKCSKAIPPIRPPSPPRSAS